MPTRRSVVHQFGAGLAALAVGSVANAETYPTHRVKIITTVAPGGTVDVLARLIAQKLSESLQQNFYVEDIPGGGGKMGAAAAARSAPDGYTLLFVFNSFITDVSLYSDVPYDPIKDFAPVTLVATSPYVLVVPPSLGVHSVQELLSLLRANPGKYSYAAPGNLVDEMFRLSNRLDIVRVPFNSAPPAIASTIGGFTQMAFTSIGAAVPNINARKLQALAVTSHKRSARFQMCQHWQKRDCQSMRPPSCKESWFQQQHLRKSSSDSRVRLRASSRCRMSSKSWPLLALSLLLTRQRNSVPTLDRRLCVGATLSAGRTLRSNETVK